MSLSSLEYLQHILDEIAYLEERTKGLSKDEFLGADRPARPNRHLRSAFCHRRIGTLVHR
jgi:hypothetical protein